MARWGSGINWHFKKDEGGPSIPWIKFCFNYTSSLSHLKIMQFWDLAAGICVAGKGCELSMEDHRCWGQIHMAKLYWMPQRWVVPVCLEKWRGKGGSKWVWGSFLWKDWKCHPNVELFIPIQKLWPSSIQRNKIKETHVGFSCNNTQHEEWCICCSELVMQRLEYWMMILVIQAGWVLMLRQQAG